MLFECMVICVLSPAHECEMRGSLVYLPIGKYFSILFKFSHGIFRLDGLVVIFFFFGNIFRVVCRPLSSIGIT